MISKLARGLLYRLIKWSKIYEDAGDFLLAKTNDFHDRAKYNESVFHYDAKISNMQNDPSKIRIGNGTEIKGELLIFNYGGEISVGNSCYIGDHSRIWSAESIIIGNNVLISHNVNIVDTNAH